MLLDIKNKDKILVIAPHPDDEVIACGGFILKYHNQIDVLCINSSGVKYKEDILSAEEIAEIRCKEFEDVMKKAKINRYHIEKIWGVPPMIEQINKHFKEYLNHFNFKDYDYIFVPHYNDNHIEHQYVGNQLLKRFLLKSGFKQNLKIVRYELWSPMTKANCYEDITDYVEEKIELINTYKSRAGANYAKRIIGLNLYRALQVYLHDSTKYVEAYFVEDVSKFLFKIDKTKIFSIYKEVSDGTIRKVVTLFGLKIKLKEKK